MLNGTMLHEDEYRVTSPLGLLTIIGLTQEDLGEYTCVAQNEAGLSASHSSIIVGGKRGFDPQINYTVSPLWFDPQTKKLEPHCITKQTAPHESTVQ